MGELAPASICQSLQQDMLQCWLQVLDGQAQAYALFGHLQLQLLLEGRERPECCDHSVFVADHVNSGMPCGVLRR